jgi:hypothetical protein
MQNEGHDARQKLLSSLAKQSGVGEDDVVKVLTPLGLNALIDHISRDGGVEALRTVQIGDLKLAARLANGSLMT